jgi:hypothetical protein
MTLQFDDVNSAARIERILVLAAGDGGGQSLALAVVAAN